MFCSSRTVSISPQAEMRFVKITNIALAQAIKWDGSSGGVIRICILTKEGAERQIFFPDEYEADY